MPDFRKSRGYIYQDDDLKERKIFMKKLLMAWVLAIVICLQRGVSMAATEDMAKIDSIAVKELGLKPTP